MKNNYDLILNFEKDDGEPLTEEEIQNILKTGEYMGKTIEHFNPVTVWKVIISQAVTSKKVL